MSAANKSLHDLGRMLVRFFHAWGVIEIVVEKAAWPCAVGFDLRAERGDAREARCECLSRVVAPRLAVRALDLIHEISDKQIEHALERLMDGAFGSRAGVLARGRHHGSGETAGRRREPVRG